MSDTIDFSIEPQYHRQYKDRLFIAIFGRGSKQSKKWRLELYNALNNTNYDNPDALEVNTIENIIYIKMYNDVSFLVDSQMTLYEQQSFPNPNFIVFYNGKNEHPEQYDLHLSDAFMVIDDSKRFEWTAHVININENYNLTLQKNVNRYMIMSGL